MIEFLLQPKDAIWYFLLKLQEVLRSVNEPVSYKGTVVRRLVVLQWELCAVIRNSCCHGVH